MKISEAAVLFFIKNFLPAGAPLKEKFAASEMFICERGSFFIIFL